MEVRSRKRIYELRFLIYDFLKRGMDLALLDFGKLQIINLKS
jgi:hypothetical protein